MLRSGHEGTGRGLCLPTALGREWPGVNFIERFVVGVGSSISEIFPSE